MTQSNRWYVVITLAALYIFSAMDRFVVSLLIEPLKASLGLTDTQIGFLIGPAFVICYAGMGIPFAWLVDRYNRIWVTALGVMLWSFSTIASGFADSYTMLVLLRMNLAIGEAVLTPAAVSLIADLFARHERSTATATYTTIGGLGSLATYALGGTVIALIQAGAFASLPILGTMQEWRATFVFIGIPSVLLGLLFLFTIRDPARQIHEAVVTDATSQVIVGVFESKSSATWFYSMFFLGTAMLTMTVTAIMGWYPSYLVRTFGLTIPEAGFLISLSMAWSLTCSFLMPFLAERWMRRGRKDALVVVMLATLGVGFPFTALSLLQTNIHWATVFMILGYGFVAPANGFYAVIVGLTAPSAYRARITAAGVACITGLGLGLGPFLVGFLTQRFFPESLATGLLAVVCISGPLAWLFIFLSWKTYRIAMSRVALG